jgi:hypothetical protein
MGNGGLTDGSKASAKKKKAWYRMEVLVGVKMVFGFRFCFTALRVVFSASSGVCESGVFSTLRYGVGWFATTIVSVFSLYNHCAALVTTTF